MRKTLIVRYFVATIAGLGLLAVGPPATADNRPSGQWGVDAFFEKADVDGDDQLTRREHAAAAQDKFNQMDTDQDGMLTAQEMSAGHDLLGKKAKSKLKVSAGEAIEKMDTNDDGNLSADEHANAAAKKFDDWDSNGDGALTRTEVAEGYKAKKSKMR